MKFRLLYFLIILFSSSCNRAMEWSEPVSDFTVLMNEEPWEENPPPIQDDQILSPAKKILGFFLDNCQDTTIMIYMARGNYENFVYNKEELIFDKIPFKIGKYKSIGEDIYCYQDNLAYSAFIPLIGDDVLGENYEVLDTENNYISIQSIDRRGGIITGKFQCTFLNVNDDTDTVRFTNGSFKTKVSVR